MKRASPLAALVLLSAVLAAAQAPATVLPEGPACATVDARGLSGTMSGLMPDCRAFNATIPDFNRLRRAAGFAPEALGYAISLDTATVNAFYWPHTKGVVFTRGYLSAGYAPAATRMIQAHEIGHAVQERDGTLAWRDEPYEGFVRRATAPVTLDAFRTSGAPEAVEYLSRNRRLEAQADMIGQELLAAAGFPKTEFARGGEQFFGCQAPSALASRVFTHPASAQRHVNAALAQSTLAAERARQAASRASAALGSSARDAGSVEAPPPAFRPLTTVHDFDERGQFKPGRIVSMKLRISPPPPSAGPVREHATNIAASFVDYWIAEPMERAVNALASDRRLAGGILESCGRPESAAAAEDFGVMTWIGRASETAVARLLGRGEKPEAGQQIMVLEGMTITAKRPKDGEKEPSEPPTKNPAR